MIYIYIYIYNALFDIVDNNNLDAMTKYEAECLYKHIKNFKFLFSIIFWYDLFNQFNPSSKLFQKIHFDISSSLKLLERLLIFFGNLRSNEAFEKFILEAIELVKEIDVEPVIEHSQGRILVRRVRRNYSYENVDEPINDSKLNLKVYFFNFILDVAINCITEIFEQLKEHNDIFLFSYEIEKFKIMTRNELIKIEKFKIMTRNELIKIC
jgi:hypothetical protein